MKFDLKNRPSYKWIYQNLDKIEKVEAWFEGFEKELKEKLKQVKKERRDHYLDFPNAPASPLWERNYGKEQIIKEILGEK